MRTLRIGLVAACLLPLMAVAQERAGLNAISQVIVRPGVVEIVGSTRPNFTTFTMANPHRLVIDISEAEFKGVPAVIAGQEMITGVKTASYGAGPGAIARVLIGFEREIETDIVAAGTTLKVVPDCFPERPVPLLCRGLPWFQNPLIDGKGLL